MANLWAVEVDRHSLEASIFNLNIPALPDEFARAQRFIRSYNRLRKRLSDISGPFWSHRDALRFVHNHYIYVAERLTKSHELGHTKNPS